MYNSIPPTCFGDRYHYLKGRLIEHDVCLDPDVVHMHILDHLETLFFLASTSTILQALEEENHLFSQDELGVM